MAHLWNTGRIDQYVRPALGSFEESRHGGRDSLHGALPADLSRRFALPMDRQPSRSPFGGPPGLHPALRREHPSAPVERGCSVPDARFLIVDDCKLNRENLAAIFAAHDGSETAVAWDRSSLCAALNEAAPAIVLFNMGTRDNMTLLRLVRDRCPEAKMIVIGISEDDEPEIVACAEAGVAGYHLRAESLDDLLTLMSRVAKEESHCSPKVSAILLRRLSTLASQRRPEANELVLTTREIQILRLLESGLSNRDIADRLCIALHTVKNHVHSVLSKLGVSTRAEAAAYSRSLRHPELAEEI
jgi:DNA-binding NarL/FixJ family response regulator